MSVFSEIPAAPEILTVLDLHWDPSTAYAKGRPFHALSLRLEGDSDFWIGDRQLHAGQDDLLFMPKDTDYTIRSNTPERVICLHFDLPLPLSEPEVFTPIEPAALRKYFLRALEAWSNKAPGYAYQVTSLFYTVLAQIAMQREQKRLVEAGDPFQLIAPVIRYIDANFTNPNLTVDELASLARISPTYLRRLFGQYLSMSPKGYIEHCRIRYATELLLSGYYTVAEVSELCGIPNPKFFSTFYKKKTGSSPSAVRTK